MRRFAVAALAALLGAAGGLAAGSAFAQSANASPIGRWSISAARGNDPSRDHGISVAFVDRLKAHGYTNLSVHDLIRLHDTGI